MQIDGFGDPLAQSAKHAAWFNTLPAYEAKPIWVGTEVEPVVELAAFDWFVNRNAPYLQTQVIKPNNWRSIGHWELDVREAGTYDVTVMERPLVAHFPIPADNIQIKIAGIERAAVIPDGAVSHTFTVELPKGRTQLETYFNYQATKPYSAFYTNVERK